MLNTCRLLFAFSCYIDLDSQFSLKANVTMEIKGAALFSLSTVHHKPGAASLAAPAAKGNGSMNFLVDESIRANWLRTIRRNEGPGPGGNFVPVAPSMQPNHQRMLAS